MFAHIQKAVRIAKSDSLPSMLRQVTKVSSIREIRKEALHRRHNVGLVPTMGALHDGHLTLIRHAAAQNHEVYVSIYVNPTQFGQNEDLGSYPRTLGKDLEKINALRKEFERNDQMGQITTVFRPNSEEMYPILPPTSEIDGDGSFVSIRPLDRILEGRSRPVFFRGVATVCMKLFNIMQPDNVYFGQKDIQQTILINRMVKDFHINTRVHIVPTMRESDDLAMSSRNVYLGERRRAVANVLIQALKAAEQAYLAGDRERNTILRPAFEVLHSKQASQLRLPSSKRVGFETDYISLNSPRTMQNLERIEPSEGAILSGAIKMLPLEDPQEGEDNGLGGGISTVRLIDNLLIEQESIMSYMQGSAAAKAENPSLVLDA